MILITCEKLSVAATIAHALGVNKKEDGYYSGKSLIYDADKPARDEVLKRPFASK